MAKKRRSSTCARDGVKANGKLKKGFRWAKNRKHCPIRAK